MWLWISWRNESVGTVISVMGLHAPEGYLALEGSQYSIADYMDLASYFETELGSKNYFGGDGTTTFAVPDARGEFIRGYDPEGGKDSEGTTRGIGKHQDAAKIRNNYRDGVGNLGVFDRTEGVIDTQLKADQVWKAEKLYWLLGHINPEEKIKNYTDYYTARPTNINVLYCIKF